MATTSITKQFVCKDEKACRKMLKEATSANSRNVRPSVDTPRLKSGEKALKQFSFR